MTTRRPAPSPDPWALPPFTREDLFAVKALQAGTANEGQQKMALDWIVQVAAATYDLAFRSGGLDGDRATAFASGKQFVGQQIVRLLNFDASKLPPKER